MLHWSTGAGPRDDSPRLCRRHGKTLFNAIFGRRDFRSALNGVPTRNDAYWCDDSTTPAKESCDEVVAAAFDAALDALQATHGKDVNTWRWDTTHFARSEHRPFSNVPVLKELFEIRTPTSGDTYSVMVGKVRGRDPDPFANEFAASLRAVYVTCRWPTPMRPPSSIPRDNQAIHSRRTIAIWRGAGARAAPGRTSTLGALRSQGNIPSRQRFLSFATRSLPPASSPASVSRLRCGAILPNHTQFVLNL